ncbi:hypothetical protein AYO21_10960 [Fonsecaea monophora]|uniref:Xylanolytic transcriptional activator regulatory domain-containing protein n=1 Tax=Fonsecaea monophora TaxID=254056 RepID=A0A177ES67_9EURO|nr:hypothetical protein AYO21_10960 [Fonsecaea monophora]OAG34855.1 hypothetical protein AYO21_10960 [Fonsecaea monophora]
MSIDTGLLVTEPSVAYFADGLSNTTQANSDTAESPRRLARDEEDTTNVAHTGESSFRDLTLEESSGDAFVSSPQNNHGESMCFSFAEQPSFNIQVGDQYNLQASFSPSLSNFFLEDGFQSAHFSDAYPCLEKQANPLNLPDVNATSATTQSATEINLATTELPQIQKPKPKLYNLTVADDLVRQLVDLFFDRVSGFVPILHRPQFYARYLQKRREDAIGQNLSLEVGLMLNSIMALSARFSNAAHFADVAPICRGESFAKEAQSIYADGTRLQGDGFVPSLQYLQGCILLSFYHNTNSSNSFGWTLTGVCARLAYDLEIDIVDEDICQQPNLFSNQWSSTEEWVLREENRRAWWSVWELDTFASTVVRRPFTIDRNKMQVLLPCSDERWYEEQPIASAPMGLTPATAWRSLQGSPNQDERAWFLVANFLMALAYDLKVQTGVSPQARAEMESALTCFSLNLPNHFRLNSSMFVFNDSTFARSNWIITTNIILQSARTYEALIVCSSEDVARSPSGSPTNVPFDPDEQRAVAQRCVQHAHEVVRAIKAWSADYIAYSSPFIVCSLVGPAAMHILQTSSEGSSALSSLNRDVVCLGIAQYARHWGLGSIMLGLFSPLMTFRPSLICPDLTRALNKLIGVDPTALTAREQELAIRYAQIAPSIRGKPRSTSLPLSSTP